VAVVEGFQRSRGLPITGAVDVTTWSQLVEANWRLGDRLLYLSSPYMRGDDVAELQVRLAQLGFNPGRIDGIFGPILEDALSDFQRNCALKVSGTLTGATKLELLRLTSGAIERSLVTDARDVAGFNDVASGPLIISGVSPLVARLVRTNRNVIEVTVIDGRSSDEVAEFANANGANLVLSIEELEHIDGVQLHYWASYRSHSRSGEQLASAIAASFSRSQDRARVEVTGMALPVLRETRMTTLRIEHGFLTHEVLGELANVISRIIAEVIHR
jgi:N-acetylmuramoyl-L-alanine amidase